MSAQKACHFSIENDYRILFVGNSSSEMMPIDSSEYSPLRPMGCERSEFGACKLGNKLLVAGGKEMEQHVTKKCEVYSMDSDTWNQVADMNVKRCKMAAVFHRGQVWVLGDFMV